MPAMGALTRPLTGHSPVVEPLPGLAGLAAMDVAERFADLPGLVLLESARSGRGSRWSYLTADPLAVLERASPGSDPFADARALLARLDDNATTGGGHPPFSGGLCGYLAYDLGRRLEQLPVQARNEGRLPELRLCLYDWVVGWDTRTGNAWLAIRSVDGNVARRERRRGEVLERLASAGQVAGGEATATAELPLDFTSNLDQAAFERMVQAVRSAIAEGELYQANVSRRLRTTFRGEPWPLYRRLRTGDPVSFAAFLDLGRVGEDGAGTRALVSASPEPFLSVDEVRVVQADPIKGTRPRGRTPEEDRQLACELLGSAKDRAENTMIVDVLRNDLGRVCEPDSVLVPRLCRLERTASVQHLVSTVTGRLEAGRDAFDLLSAAFPGGSITGAPKIRAMELIETLEPVRRGPYTGALVWIGAGGQMGSSILIRTFVADGESLSLHVGGGITWRSEPSAEWDETLAKARGPLAAIGGREAVARGATA